METSLQAKGELEALEVRLKAILPEQYQDCYEDVQPESMGSAGLVYGRDGKVDWDEIWGSFCDLAMAGGPPHKGKLLEPGSAVEIEVEAERYKQVVDEIRRGIKMVTELVARQAAVPGWIDVECAGSSMAGWLARAIVMENVSARCEGTVLKLPAGPAYRLEKEIKNVITAIAKTCHYWQEHMWASQQRDVAKLFAKMEGESPLIQPALPGYGFDAEQHQMLCGKIGAEIRQATGLLPYERFYAGWFGLEFPDVQAAIWVMRGLVASNVMARREDNTLFVAVNPTTDPTGEIVTRLVVQIHGFAAARGVV